MTNLLIRSILLSLVPLLSSRVILTALKEALMGSRPSPEISCILCSKPVDLRTDLCADENGKAIHEDCYVARVTSNRSDPKLREGEEGKLWEGEEGLQMSDSLPSQAFIEFVNSATTPWAAISRPACGTALKYRDCTFFYEGQTWEIPLPICVRCHPITRVVPPYQA